MTHLEIKINNIRTIKVSLADSWLELTPSQVLFIADKWEAYRTLAQHDLPMQKAKALLFINLILNKTKKEIEEICKLFSKYDFEANDLNILSVTEFIFKNNGLITNQLPVIKIGFCKKLYGPIDKLDNISIHEFSFAINYFNLYSTTRDTKFLDYLICVLYRARKAGGLERGDTREPFNMNTTDRYLNKISKLDHAYKQAVYLFFQGCLESWLTAFPLVFKRGKEEQNAAPHKTFLDIILNISGGKFGTFSETKNENAYLVLKELNTVLTANAEQQNKK